MNTVTNYSQSLKSHPSILWNYTKNRYLHQYVNSNLFINSQHYHLCPYLLNPVTSTRNFITILKWVDYPLAPCPRCLIPRVSEYHQDHIQVAYHGDKTKFFGTFLPRFFSRGVLSRHGTTNLNSIDLFYLDLFWFSYPDKNNLCILKASCPRVWPFPPFCMPKRNRKYIFIFFTSSSYTIKHFRF